MHNFTPIPAAIGGVLIGLSAARLWLANGSIAGISGIVGGLATAGRGERGWRLAFLAGLIAAPLLYWAMEGRPDISLQAEPAAVVVAGLLVGFGTRLGGGCTSGHGVCGLARLSRRSVLATVLFMAAAAATVVLVRHVFGG